MVLVTIVTTSNPHTLYFDHAITKPSYIRLLSASIFNSWNNLKENGIMTVKLASDADASPTYVSITAGHDTPESMAKTITESFAKKKNVHLPVDTRASLGVMNILNPKNKFTMSLTNNLKSLFGVVSQVNAKNIS